MAIDHLFDVFLQISLDFRSPSLPLPAHFIVDILPGNASQYVVDEASKASEPGVEVDPPQPDGKFCTRGDDDQVVAFDCRQPRGGEGRGRIDHVDPRTGM